MNCSRCKQPIDDNGAVFITMREGKTYHMHPDCQLAKANKYNNRRVYTEDGVFDSGMEYQRWLALKEQAEQGEISQLRRQVNIPLVVEGQKVCDYRADFTYRLPDNTCVVEDVKGVVTPEFRLKAKLFKALKGYEITVVTKNGQKKTNNPART